MIGEWSLVVLFVIFFFKQKTAYEMRISDWSSDVCSSDLPARRGNRALAAQRRHADHPPRQQGGRQAGRKRPDGKLFARFRQSDRIERRTWRGRRRPDRKSVV